MLRTHTDDDIMGEEAEFAILFTASIRLAGFTPTIGRQAEESARCTRLRANDL